MMPFGNLNFNVKILIIKFNQMPIHKLDLRSDFTPIDQSAVDALLNVMQRITVEQAGAHECLEIFAHIIMRKLKIYLPGRYTNEALIVDPFTFSRDLPLGTQIVQLVRRSLAETKQYAIQHDMNGIDDWINSMIINMDRLLLTLAESIPENENVDDLLSIAHAQNRTDLLVTISERFPLEREFVPQDSALLTNVFYGPNGELPPTEIHTLKDTYKVLFRSKSQTAMIHNFLTLLMYRITTNTASNNTNYFDALAAFYIYQRGVMVDRSEVAALYATIAATDSRLKAHIDKYFPEAGNLDTMYKILRIAPDSETKEG
jgi:hypothetical protein